MTVLLSLSPFSSLYAQLSERGIDLLTNKENIKSRFYLKLSNYFFQGLNIWAHCLDGKRDHSTVVGMTDCVEEQRVCLYCASLTRWGRLFEFDKVETNLEERQRTNGPSVLPETVCGSYHSHPYSVCTLTLTPAPAHYFLMSNHHLTGAQDRHERQPITHGNSVGRAMTIRHKKCLGDKCCPGSIFTPSERCLKRISSRLKWY